MRSVSDVLHNHGGTTEYTTKSGKQLKIKYLTLKGMSEYENALQNRAINKLAQQANIIPQATFDKMFSDLLDRIASGAYAFGSELCTKSLGTVNGVTDLVSIMCGISNDEALDLLISEGDHFRKIIDEVLRKSISSNDDDHNVVEGKD